MKTFPFTIPPSLNSYVEQFDADQARMTRKLERHVSRRDPETGKFEMEKKPVYHIVDDKEKKQAS